MRLYTFEIDGAQRLGAEHNGKLVDLQAAYAAQGGDPAPAVWLVDMLSLVRGGPPAMEAAQLALAFAVSSPEAVREATFDLAQVSLQAPLPRPGKILCSGVNYRGHLEENPDAVLPKYPFFFAKFPSAVVGPGDPIVLPALSDQSDYEVELAVVIGRTTRHVPEERAMECVAGYTILHDVSARDVQFQDAQITLGKNFDSFAPMGPCMVTAEEIPDPGNLRLRTLLNGQVMQDSSTADWFYPLPELLSFLSSVMTLDPGDLVSTGTPAGVGYFQQPRVFLKPGDTVVLEVEGIGRLENPVVAETGGA